MELEAAHILIRYARAWIDASASSAKPAELPNSSSGNGVRNITGYRTGDALGLCSVKRDNMDGITLKKENAGDQLCFEMSMQMLPWSEILDVCQVK